MYAASFIWAKVISRLEERQSEEAVRRWLKNVEVVEHRNGELIIFLPSRIHRTAVKHQCAHLIEQAVWELFGMEWKLRILDSKGLRDYWEQRRSENFLQYNPDFSFENFEIRPSNYFAAKIAGIVAEEPGREPFNPLILKGPSGAGKSRLLYTIANQMLRNHPEMNVVCVRAEQFVNELVDSMCSGKMDQFREKYRNSADALLVDDLYAFSGREIAQEELCAIVSDLQLKGRQVVMTAEQDLDAMPGLSDGFLCCLYGGLLAEVDGLGKDDWTKKNAKNE